eukprot:4967792-Pyramimonas_sp.AAC.2
MLTTKSAGWTMTEKPVVLHTTDFHILLGGFPDSSEKTPMDAFTTERIIKAFEKVCPVTRKQIVCKSSHLPLCDYTRAEAFAYSIDKIADFTGHLSTGALFHLVGPRILNHPVIVLGLQKKEDKRAQVDQEKATHVARDKQTKLEAAAKVYATHWTTQQLSSCCRTRCRTPPLRIYAYASGAPCGTNIRTYSKTSRGRWAS